MREAARIAAALELSMSPRGFRATRHSVAALNMRDAVTVPEPADSSLAAIEFPPASESCSPPH